MASRTSSSARALRSHLNPYERNSSKTSPQARSLSISPLTPPSTSPQELASPVSSPSPSGTRREHYLQTCKRFYPDIQPRHDWDIIVLATVEDGSAWAQLIQEATDFLDTRDTPTGVKPSPGEEDVHIRPIPRSQYSLRMWGKGLEEKREYCLDFVLTATGKPVNSPLGYELWVVPNRSAPWLPAGTSRLYSLERSFGIAQEDILPGEEKFVLLEGTACMLKRAGMRPVYFEVPVRPRASVNDADTGTVDVLTFGAVVKVVCRSVALVPFTNVFKDKTKNLGEEESAVHCGLSIVLADRTGGVISSGLHVENRKSTCGTAYPVSQDWVPG